MLCPHCNQKLDTRKVKGHQTALDYCTVCEAAWFEKGELPSLLGHDPESSVEIPDNPLRLDDTLCPKCRKALLMFAYPGTGRVIEGCGECGGVWIDREDLDEIRGLPAPEPKPPKPAARAKKAAPKRPPVRARKIEPVAPAPSPPPRRIVRERIRFSEEYGLAFSKLLLQSGSLRIDQEIPSWAETKLRLVVPNTYRVRSLRGSTLGWAEEQGRGLRAMIRRSVERHDRNFVMHVRGRARKEAILRIEREQDRLIVTAGDRKLGSVVRQGDGPPNGWELKGKGGRRFAVVRYQPRPRKSTRGTTPSDWEFPIEDKTGLVHARITKKWAGTWKETTSDSDNFRVDYGTHRWSPEQRAVIFAAVFAIDFDLFEDDNPEDGRE